MKTGIKSILLSLLFLSFSSQGLYAEWGMGKKIDLNGPFSSIDNNKYVFNPNNRKMYFNGYIGNGDIFIHDPQTLVTVGKMNFNQHRTNGLTVDNKRNILYSLDEGGFISIDCFSNKKIGEYNGSINLNMFTLDTSDNKIYLLSGDEEIVLDGTTLTEDFRIPLPPREDIVTATHEGLYRTQFIDEENKRLYVAFIKPISEYPIQYPHKDSVYVIDTVTQELIHAIPVGPGPRDIIKNKNNGNIYVFCDGKYVYEEYYDRDHVNDFGGIIPSGENRIIISVINSSTIELSEDIDIGYNWRSHQPYKAALSEQHNMMYYEGFSVSCDTHETLGSYCELPDLPWIMYETKYIFFDDYTDELILCSGEVIGALDVSTLSLKRMGSKGIRLERAIYSPPTNSLIYSYKKWVPDWTPMLGIYDFGSESIARESIISDTNIRLGLYTAHPTENVLYNAQYKRLITYDIQNGTVVQSIDVNFDGLPLPGTNVKNIVFDEELQRVYVLDWKNDPDLYVFDTSTLSLLKRMKLGNDFRYFSDFIIDPINHKLYIAGGYNPDYSGTRLAVFDCVTNEILITKEVEKITGGGVGIAVFPDEQKLYIIHGNSEDNNYKVSIYDALSLQNIGKLTDISGSINYSGMNMNYPANELIISCTDKVIIIDTTTGTIKKTLPVDSSMIIGDALFSPTTGKLFLVSYGTATIQIYEDPDFNGYQAPPPPGNSSVKNTGRIRLSWSPVNHADLQGYNIYRSPAGADQWIRLNSELVTQTSYLDETAIPNTPYDYRVSTMGLHNIEGEPSAPVTATLILDPDFNLLPVLCSKSASLNSVAEYYITSESIEQFAALIDLRVEGLPEGIDYTFSSNPLRPGETSLLRCTMSSDVSPGTYNFEVIGAAGDIEHREQLKLRVVETDLTKSVITLDMSSSYIEFGSAVYATGRITPPASDEVSVTFTSIHGTETVSATSGSDGTYSIDFEPPSAGEWTVSASWSGNATYAGAESEAQPFGALSGRTKITCTTDASADAEVGWQMTIKGKVYPNPGVGSVTMYVKKPDGTEEEINGLMINELGYYGYNITADQPGFWEVTASWAGNDRYLGSVSETLVVPYGLDIGRAIIAVCPSDSRPFYSTANRLGRLAYKTFASRRFDAPRIQYFDVNENQDLNEDGFIRDVEGPPTLANIEQAITDWAAQSVDDETPLCIYLLGEGSFDGIELSDGNTLSASGLHEMLSDLETSTGCDDVVIVVDAPHSGSFVRELSSLGRCVVTSTNLGDAAFIAQGKLSFSQFFCNAASEGKSIRDAFLYTKNTLSRLPGGFKDQNPLVESDGNLIANEAGDYQQTSNWYFGSSYGLQDLMPRVKSMSLASVTREGGVGKVVTTSQSILSDTQSPALKIARASVLNGVDVWLRVDDAESNISSVHAAVFTPEGGVLEEFELFDDDGDGKYVGQITGIDNLGSYDIVGYALDESENVSEPMKSLVVVVNSEGVGVAESIVPESFKVYAPYPNPFNPTTTLKYEIPLDAQVEVVVYDILGQKIRVLEDSYLTAGIHELVWDGKSEFGKDVGSGVYLYQVKAGEFVKQDKMVLVR